MKIYATRLSLPIPVRMLELHPRSPLLIQAALDIF
jgi:hypothetical protein